MWEARSERRWIICARGTPHRRGDRATGATIEAGILGVRHQNPKHIVLAAPVGAPDSLERLRPLVDEIVCLHAPIDFMSVSVFYRHFEQTTDAEVMKLLEQLQPAGRQ